MNNIKVINDMHSMEDFNTSSFSFSGISVDVLYANEYTLVTLILDMSSSVHSYFNELQNMIKTTIETLRDPRAPFAENILLRLVTFNNDVYEEHGFVPITSIDINAYSSIQSPRGITGLYDACINAAEATKAYGLNLTKQDFEVNAINIVVTDGGDNCSLNYGSDVKKLTNDLTKEEAVESIRSILVGVNTRDNSIKNILSKFHTEGGFDQYIDIEDATPSAMAKLSGFVSQSISMQVQANGSGTASKAVELSF